MRTNPELRTVFMQEVKEVLTGMVNAQSMTPVEEEEESVDVSNDIMSEINSFAC